MKKSIKLFALLAFAAGALTLSSCSEETPDDPTPADPVCYMTSYTQGNATTNFAYNSDNQVIKAMSSDDTTVFEYSGGRLATAYDGEQEATFIYDAGNVPSRINLKEDGLDAGYFSLENTNGNITKIEVNEDADNISSVTNITYDADGNIASLLVQTYNEDTQEFETSLQVSDLLTDGKKNPYSSSFALIFSNLESPLVFGQGNIISGQTAILGNNVPITGTHTYNSNDYALTSEVSIYTASYTFDCK